MMTKLRVTFVLSISQRVTEYIHDGKFSFKPNIDIYIAYTIYSCYITLSSFISYEALTQTQNVGAP